MQAEFRVSPDALLPVGTALGAAHFIPGQHVDVQALTKGKGFAGVMKRHGFKGQPRTHGHSLSHRSGGAIGRQGISRVLPGQRMAGRMGGIKSVQSNCWVHRCACGLSFAIWQHDIPCRGGANLTCCALFRWRYNRQLKAGNY